MTRDNGGIEGDIKTNLYTETRQLAKVKYSFHEIIEVIYNTLCGGPHFCFSPGDIFIKSI